MITAQQLIKVGVSSKLANLYVTSLNDTMVKYQINTKLRKCHYLAQVLHESGRLFYNEEIASGAAYDTGKLAIALGNTPENDGDGEKYKGRGFIQITGTSNYRAISKDLGVDFLNHPDLLEQLPYCALSSGWYWNKRNLNLLADKDDVKAVTKKVNGGYNGLEDRMKLLTALKLAIPNDKV